MNGALFALQDSPLLNAQARLAQDLLTMMSPSYLRKVPADGLIQLRDRIGNVLGDQVRQYEMFAFTGAAAAPPTVQATEPVMSEDVAACLSPSQVKTFLDCQTKWFYKYGLRLPDTKGSALALGIAFHEAIATNFRQKVQTRKDLETGAVVEVFQGSWTRELETARLEEGEDAADLGSMGAIMTEQYMSDVAPLIQPAAVEVAVEGKMGGVRVQGKIDVLDEHGTVIDAKTAAKKPYNISPDYQLQVTTYSQLHPEAKGMARLDTVTKTKTINTVSQSFQVLPSHVAYAEKIYPLVQEGMRGGLYVPNRGSNLCSRKYCPYWNRCEEEYGGTVDAR